MPHKRKGEVRGAGLGREPEPGTIGLMAHGTMDQAAVHEQLAVLEKAIFECLGR